VRLLEEANRINPGMRSAARATAERFGIDAMAEKLIALYQSLAKRAVA